MWKWIVGILGVVFVIAIIVIIIVSIPNGPEITPDGSLGEYIGLLDPLDELSSSGPAEIYQTQGPQNCAFDQGPCAYNIVRQDEYTCTFNKPIDSNGIAPGSHFNSQCTRQDSSTYTGRFRWQT